MCFDFDAAVHVPFRMQPGLRRLAAGAAQLTPLAPGARHLREKLVVLSTHADQALRVAPGFDPMPALDALCRQAAVEHPAAWSWDGQVAHAAALGLAVADGQVRVTAAAHTGAALRCLQALPTAWRLPGLLSLAFAEDFAVLDARDTRIPWLAVALPSFWAPEDKVGRAFAEVHGPVADNALLLQAAEALSRLVSGTERWERFVWTITPHGPLHAHPHRVPPDRCGDVAVEDALWRTERQTFIPVPGAAQAVFTILVDVQPLAHAIATPARAARLQASVASMSPAVLAYRGLDGVRAELLAWLAARC